MVSRLRKDAALGSVPAPVQPGTRRRGRPRKYGSASISLAKRAGQRRGWQKGDFVLYGTKGGKQYKTFLATDQPVGGWIRVVLVKEAEHGVAYVCPPVEGTVADIREAVADRRAIEQTVHDLKEVHGTGQQQLRNYWADIAAYHGTLWWHTLIALWAWHKPHPVLTDRSVSPWDDPARRPAHADRRNALRRSCFAVSFRDFATIIPPTIRRLCQSLMQLVA